MEDLIFSYTLADAWGFTHTKLELFDRQEDNVITTSSKPGSAMPDKEIRRTIDSGSLDKIKKIIEENPEVLEIEDIEHATILDGASNRFYFRSNNKENEIYASNLWSVEEGNSDLYREKPVKAIQLFQVFDEIRKILNENGVGKKYLSLFL